MCLFRVVVGVDLLLKRWLCKPKARVRFPTWVKCIEHNFSFPRRAICLMDLPTSLCLVLTNILTFKVIILFN